MSRTRVLIVDDSALMRELLTEIINADPELETAGVAPNPVVAWQKIKALNPQVLTLDVEMPRMDGVTFLEKLMIHRPMPVVMISSLTPRGGDITLRALELGAVDFVTKPQVGVRDGTLELAKAIVEKVKIAARARLRPRRSPSALPGPKPAHVSAGALVGTHQVIAIGASTGGTDALEVFLSSLPPNAPGVVVVQHMPEKFTRSFAERLDRHCQIRVKEAERGDRILPGHALIAPGNFHMRVTRSGFSYRVQVVEGAPVNGHRPSVDVLFDSCARQLGVNAVGVIMTGMGDDGARGLLSMRQAGAWTMAQDEETCVVFGMPAAAIKLGAAQEVLPLEALSGAALRAAGRHHADSAGSDESGTGNASTRTLNLGHDT
jgi:two-component system, chemotaxis family, protein-glutamate methylesterase/glutaminase